MNETIETIDADYKIVVDSYMNFIKQRVNQTLDEKETNLLNWYNSLLHKLNTSRSKGTESYG